LRRVNALGGPAIVRRFVSLLIVPLVSLAACSSPAAETSSSQRAAGPEAEAVSMEGAQGGRASNIESEGETAGSEVEEEQNVTAERLEALQTAIADGTFGATGQAAVTDAAPGWYGEQVVQPKVDDWEPAVATDPSAPYVYVLTTRYGEPKTCPSHCPTPFIALTISRDGGRTFGDQVPLCVCRGSGAQYDPTIEVVPNTGAVYAVFLNADRAGGFSTVFIRSNDHGKTWTDPVHVYGKVAWTDKPEQATSASGRDVYVSWNGPTGGDLYVGQSHDFGRTWTEQKIVDSKRYFYAYDGRVLPDGTVIFSESSETYSGSKKVRGKVWHHLIVSRTLGHTWDNIIVDNVPTGEACVAAGCSPDFYTGQTSVAFNSHGHLVYAYEGPATSDGPQRIYVRTSDDRGRTWSVRTALSVAGENATGPRLAAAGVGDVRLWYMQTANHDDPNAWNVWYRRSTDGGKTWSKPVKLDDAPAGAARYVNEDGFKEIYGDYGEIGITSAGKTFAVWGEGFSWTGPGGSWYNLQK
jgi:anti-sigma28 factor (negative regulator of flagellin synthesis)